MLDLENLIRQHNRIFIEINFIVGEVEKGKDMNIAETVSHINKLAGQLVIHLMNEDKFLYPKLLNSKDSDIQKLAMQYSNEMGDLENVFTKYKNDYNTSTKIKEKENLFIIDTKKVMQSLTNRINKEDNELYKLIKEKNI